MRFVASKSGNIALMFAIVLPLLLGAAGAAIDYAHYHVRRQSLQQMADKAALAGARQYVISDAQGRIPANVARDVAEHSIADAGFTGALPDVSANREAATVTVAISYSFTPSFLVGMFESPLTLQVSATAQAKGSANVCVIGLKETGNDVIHLDDSASLSGELCAVYVNSTGGKALVSKASASLTAVQTCTAGGYEGGANNFDPQPTTDCPPRVDPLAERAAPSPPGPCDYTDRKLKNFTGSIAPGVYCKGLQIDGDSAVTFQPGTYFIKDGKFEIKDNAKIEGVDVGFFFYGDGSELIVENEAEVELHAPISGEMAGILFWQDPASLGPKKFIIKSPNVSTLVGTIYLPKGEFVGEIDGGGAIAEASAYTAIIAEKITLKKSSNLVLHSNYKATNVPAPEGIKASDGTVFLRE